MTGPSGIAPTIEAPGVDQTALCRHCAEPIRYWPCPGQHHRAEPWPLTEDPQVAGLCRYCLAAPEQHHDRAACTGDRWRHVIARPRPEADYPLPMSESEARLLDGNR